MKNINEYAAIEKLRLTTEESDLLTSWAGILEKSFTALGPVNTDGVLPLVSVLDLRNILREDIPQQMIQREELMKNAPEQYEGYFQVPKTLD